jgi:hypothetical protein
MVLSGIINASLIIFGHEIEFMIYKSEKYTFSYEKAFLHL